MHTAARTPHTARYTTPRSPHAAHRKKNTQSHTRPPRHTHDSLVRLPSVDGMLPESWLFCKANNLHNTRTAIASHDGTRRRPESPASRPRRISVQRTASIKSSRMKASQHTACYRSRTTPCASDPETTQPNSPQVSDAVIPPYKPATRRRSRTSQRDTQRYHARANKRSAQNNNNTATATVSECRKGRTCRTATRRRLTAET